MKAGKGACMGMTAFDPDSSTNGMLDRGWEAPRHHESGPESMAQAVADLLQHKSLISTFGDQGEWEVRTTLAANRQAWRYHSSVFLHGKERKRGFPPINVDRTRQIRHTGTVTEELLTAFAREAAEVHVNRCDGIKEYLSLASFFSPPVPRYHRTKKVVLALLSVAALLTAYWWWIHFNGIRPEQPDRQSPSYRIQWQPLQISHHYRAGEPFEFPLPRLERMPEEMPVEVTLEASGDQPSWLQLDRERLHIRGTAPLTAANQTYRLSVRAHTVQGSDSRLLVLLTITGQPDRSPPVRPLPGHWTW
jgi:Putative Ig domain